jgi:hypothetical protein
MSFPRTPALTAVPLAAIATPVFEW